LLSGEANLPVSEQTRERFVGVQFIIQERRKRRWIAQSRASLTSNFEMQPL
jgi:hypothetical protein